MPAKNRLLPVLLLGLAAVLFMICSGLIIIPQMIGHLVVGWILYIGKTWPQVRLSWTGLATSAALLLLFAGGLHVASARITGRFGLARWTIGRTAACVLIVVLMFTSGISSVAIFHQTGWLLNGKIVLADFEPAQRSQSRNSMRQIGLATHNSADEHKSHFPAGSTFTEDGVALHSWETLLLPFLDQKPLADKIDLTRPWTAEANRDHFRIILPIFLNPKIERKAGSDGRALSHYAQNSHLAQVGATKELRIADIKDGTSSTILAGEVSAGFCAWGDPVNWRDPALGLAESARTFGSVWSGGGVQFLLCDGSVRFVDGKIDPQVLKALSTPAGGDVMGDF